MRITAASISDFKRVRSVAIRPDADRTLILIGGDNAQGKSSVLDALTAAFGGKRSQPAEPVRRGAKAAEIIVELDGGELIIKRVIQPDGASALEVRGREGPLKSPQAALDKLVGTRFLDPVAFLGLAPKEQRAALLAIIDKENKLAALETRRERIFGFRRDVGRDLDKAKGELARLPPVVVLHSPAMDVAALAQEQTALLEKRLARDRKISALKAAEEAVPSAERVRATLDRQVASIAAQIEKLQRDLNETKAAIEQSGKDILARIAVRDQAREEATAADQEWCELLQPKLDKVARDLANADVHNKGITEAQASNARREAAEAEVKRLEAQREKQTTELDKIEAQKVATLAAAQLPVEGLSVNEEGILLGGVPFAQASAAERVRVSLGIAIAASPNLDDIWVRDGALLDEHSLAAVASHAAAAGKRVWMERVGDADEEAIIIADGAVVQRGD